MPEGEGPTSFGVANWRASPANERLLRQFSDPDYDDSDWAPVTVPGHWQTERAFADHDGTLLHRADLTVPRLGDGQRRWIRFRGLCDAADVFLDGVYLGPTDGYYTTHRFEITDLAQYAGTSVLAVEVAAPNVRPDGPKRSLTGWFTDAPAMPASWNPAGIWGSVECSDTGPIAIRHFRAICADADAKRATLQLRAIVLAAEPGTITLQTEVCGHHDTTEQVVAAGENRLEWTVDVADPVLWWPHGHGDQALHDLRVTVLTERGSISDRVARRIGFRTTSMTDFIVRVNGRRIFCAGVNVAPFRPDLANATADELHAEARAIRDAGFTMVRIRSHVTRREFLDACDELGLLVWQDLPLVGLLERRATARAEQHVRELVDLHGHRPSIVVWGAHMRPHTNEPRTTAAPNLRQQQWPSWNRTVIDRAISREFRKSDPSRPCVSHSDVAPHVPRLAGSDVALHFGWLDGDAADLVEFAATLPRLVRFATDLGAQALPADLSGGLDALLSAPGAEADALRAQLPPASFDTVDEWADASRWYQAEVMATTLDILRVLKYRPCGGFFAGLWKAPGPGLHRGLFDHDGTPRPVLDAVRRGIQPIHPVVYPPLPDIPSRTTSRVSVHLCNDSHDDTDFELWATIVDQRGERTQVWSGRATADEVSYVAELTIRGGRIGDIATVRLEVRAPGNAGDPIATNERHFRAI